MNSILGFLEDAEANGKECKVFLKSETVTAKRILAAWSKANGQAEFVETLVSQAEECLKKERIVGVRKFEEILISRILLA